MRLFRRRRRVAVALLLLTFAALVFLTSHVPVIPGNLIPGSDVRHVTRPPGYKGQGPHPQAVFKDLAVKDKNPKSVLKLRHQNKFATTITTETYDQTSTENSTVLHKKVNESQIFYNTHWMTIHGGGRLGNAMFQYASLVGISSYHGYMTKLPSSHSLRRVFKIRSPPSLYLKTKVKTKREKNPGIFDTALLDLDHDTNWTLIGYYQSWKYFGNISEKIIQEFTFRDKIIKEMLKEAPILANWTRVTVGVHVRRGDMASKYEQDRGYNVANVGFLKRSMNYFRKKYENPIFVICSDSITWCKDNLMADDTIFTKGSREVDLATLAHCDHNIVTSGSFGWWGAWLAGGDVVYFKHFPRENTWLDRQYNKEDYYPPSWIPMD